MVINSDTAKSQVLGDIRSALTQFSESERAELKRRFDNTTASSTPRPVVDGRLIDHFVEKHTAVNGTVKIVSSHSEVPGAVSEYLESHHLPSDMVMGETDFLHGFDWPDEWKIERRPALKTDEVSVTDAICAIAETGSIVIASSSQVSSTHLYVPENHIVVMNVGQLVRHLDDALLLVTQQLQAHSRGIHMITGPSKTADVEQTIQYGAHGPRRLHAIFVDSTTA